VKVLIWAEYDGDIQVLKQMEQFPFPFVQRCSFTTSQLRLAILWLLENDFWGLEPLPFWRPHDQENSTAQVNPRYIVFPGSSDTKLHLLYFLPKSSFFENWGFWMFRSIFPWLVCWENQIHRRNWEDQIKHWCFIFLLRTNYFDTCYLDAHTIIFCQLRQIVEYKPQ